MPIERHSGTTLKDIATACGVSHTAVSFVLRGREMGISQETSQEILKNAIQLDYRTRGANRLP